MAKYETTLTGDFRGLLAYLQQGILDGSVSASLEDGSDFEMGGVRCAVRVFERYSYLGKNRLSLTLTLLGDGKSLRLSAIASGGSQAIFFKINTFGEQAFLDRLIALVDAWRRKG